MAVYAIPALKTLVNSTIYSNTQYLITADTVEQRMQDIIDSLQSTGLNIVDTDYTTFKTALDGGTLNPGYLYLFDYENVHEVANEGVVNTALPGYVASVEKLMVIATTASSISGEVISVQNPNDTIIYDPSLDTVLATPRNGFILKRIDNDKDIETPFDFRNTWVARYGLDTSGLPTPASPSNKGTLLQDGGTVYMCIRDGVTGWNPDDFISVGTVGSLQTPAFSRSTTDAVRFVQGTDGLQSIPIDLGLVSYELSVSSALNANISVGFGSSDVHIRANSVDIGRTCSAISVIGTSSDVEIKDGATRVHLKDSSKINVGNASSEVTCFTNSYLDIKGPCDRVFASFCVNNTIGENADDTVLQGSNRNTVGIDASVTFITDSSNDNTILNGAGGVELFQTFRNNIGHDCSDIRIYGGSDNTFKNNCSVINFFIPIGFAPGTDYAPMQENFFDNGCSNMTFDFSVGGTGVRNTKFGSGCSDNTFVGTVRGCEFGKNIKNKTFNMNLEEVTFVGASDIAAVMATASDFYSPVLNMSTSETDVPTLNGLDNQGLVNTLFWDIQNGADSPDVVSPPKIGTVATTWRKVFGWYNDGKPLSLMLTF